MHVEAVLSLLAVIVVIGYYKCRGGGIEENLLLPGVATDSIHRRKVSEHYIGNRGPQKIVIFEAVDGASGDPVQGAAHTWTLP